MLRWLVHLGKIKLSIIIIDVIFTLAYLGMAVVFYTAKNICNSISPLECYSYFCVFFVFISVINSLINLDIPNNSKSKVLLCYKIALNLFVVVVFVIVRLQNS